jgi:hypothetical protein
MPSLVGSEMCIRDRYTTIPLLSPQLKRFNTRRRKTKKETLFMTI